MLPQRITPQWSMDLMPQSEGSFPDIDRSLVVTESGNSIKADADDPTNPRINYIPAPNVANDIHPQVTTNDPISNVIGTIMGLARGVFDAIGGII